MHILWTVRRQHTIIIGLLVDVLAKLIMPGRDPRGVIITTLLGIGGAFVATYLGQAIGWYQPGESAGFVGAVIAAERRGTHSKPLGAINGTMALDFIPVAAKPAARDSNFSERAA